MKVYIASSLSNIENVRGLRDALVRLGHEITYDWTVHGSIAAVYDTPAAVRVAEAEAQGVADADAVIVLLTEAMQKHGGRGSHTELGVAIGLRKRVFLVGPRYLWVGGHDGYPCVFYRHPCVTPVGDTYELVGRFFPPVLRYALPDFVREALDLVRLSGPLKELGAQIHAEALGPARTAPDIRMTFSIGAMRLQRMFWGPIFEFHHRTRSVEYVARWIENVCFEGANALVRESLGAPPPAQPEMRTVAPPTLTDPAAIAAIDAELKAANE